MIASKKNHPLHLKVHPSNRGLEKINSLCRKSYFSLHQSIKFWFLNSKRYDTWGLLACNPFLPKTPLRRSRGFSGEEGCRIVTPKCHAFLVSRSKSLLIGEEKIMIFLNGFFSFKSGAGADIRKTLYPCIQDTLQN